MKIYETEASLEHGTGDILKLKMTTHEETKTYWGYIVESPDGEEFLVLLDVGIMEAIDDITIDQISTTEDTYLISKVYKNSTLRLE